MINMSFYDGTMNRKMLKQFILDTDKPIVYTYGYTWKNPTTYRVPKTKEQAIAIVDAGGMLDAREENSCLHLNEFSANDMW